jgi:predicted permease
VTGVQTCALPISIDPSVAGFAFVLVVGTGLAFGLAPSLFAAQGGAIAAGLRRGGRAGATGSRSPIREGLVVTQLALATLLALGAALLGQSFLRLQKVPLGFDAEKVLTARLTLPEIRTDEEMKEAQALCSALVAEVRTLPGVTLAGLTSEVPMGLINTGMDVGAIPGSGAGGAGGGAAGKTSDLAPVQASWRIVTSDYLRALQVPLRQGRFFAADDEPADSTLLSEGLARRLFPGADPIGRRIWLGNGQARTVVGVVGDVHQIGVTNDATPTMYFSTSWYLWSTMILTVRTEGDPAALAGPLRDAVRRVAPEVPLFDVAPLTSAVEANVAPPRLQALVVILFAALSLTLAAVGVAGVVAYSVAQRTPELAVRAALGATPKTVVGHVLRRGLALCGAGVGLGVLLAAILAGGLEGLLYCVEAREPGIYALVSAVLLAAGGLACWLPARRAAAIPPVRALQGE